MAVAISLRHTQIFTRGNILPGPTIIQVIMTSDVIKERLGLNCSPMFGLKQPRIWEELVLVSGQRSLSLKCCTCSCDEVFSCWSQFIEWDTLDYWQCEIKFPWTILSKFNHLVFFVHPDNSLNASRWHYWFIINVWRKKICCLLSVCPDIFFGFHTFIAAFVALIASQPHLTLVFLHFMTSLMFHHSWASAP